MGLLCGVVFKVLKARDAAAALQGATAPVSLRMLHNMFFYRVGAVVDVGNDGVVHATSREFVGRVAPCWAKDVSQSQLLPSCL